MKIFIDVYMLIDFTIDYISLSAVEKILLLHITKRKCIIGAIIGTAYSLISFFYKLPCFLHILVVILILFLITPRATLTQKAMGVTAFMLCEFFIGGCVSALRQLSILLPKKGLVLALFIIIMCILCSYAYSILQILARQRLKSIALTAKLWHRDKCSELLLMVDSGNLVREYSTGRRALFVKSSSIEKSVGDVDTLFEREKCYVIPIETASGHDTVLGFVPDRIEFSDKKYNEEKFLVIPDVQGGKFGGYDGIAPFI